MGGAIGVAIYTTILSNAYAPRLIRNINEVVATTGFPKSDTASLIEAAFENTATAYKAVPHITGEIINMSELAVKKGYGMSSRYEFSYVRHFADQYDQRTLSVWSG